MGLLVLETHTITPRSGVWGSPWGVVSRGPTLQAGLGETMGSKVTRLGTVGDRMNGKQTGVGFGAWPPLEQKHHQDHHALF